MSGYIILIIIISVVSVFPVFSEPSITYSKEIGGISLKNITLNMYARKKSAEYSMDSGEYLAEKIIAYTEIPVLINTRLFRDEDNGLLTLKGTGDPTVNFKMNPELGEIIATSGYREYIGKTGDTPNLLKKENLEEASLVHLKNLGLLPGKESIGCVSTQEMRMGTSKKGGPNNDYCKFQLVRYDRMIDGLPVHGASRIITQLAEGGRLHSLIYRWMEVEKAPLEVQPELFDFNTIERKAEERLLKMSKNAKEIKIESMELVLFDDGENYIEPAIYVVAYRKNDNSKKDTPMDFYIPVAKNSRANFPFKVDAAIRPRVSTSVQ